MERRKAGRTMRWCRSGMKAGRRQHQQQWNMHSARASSTYDWHIRLMSHVSHDWHSWLAHIGSLWLAHIIEGKPPEPWIIKQGTSVSDVGGSLLNACLSLTSHPYSTMSLTNTPRKLHFSFSCWLMLFVTEGQGLFKQQKKFNISEHFPLSNFNRKSKSYENNW